MDIRSGNSTIDWAVISGLASSTAAITTNRYPTVIWTVIDGFSGVDITDVVRTETTVLRTGHWGFKTRVADLITT